MSVKFRVIGRRNPQDITAPQKFYANAVGDGEIGFEELSEMIAYQCTVTEADCSAVLIALERNIIAELEQGRIVKLGKLGSFQIGISSEGKVTAAEVNANSILKSRILFRPEKKMRQSLPNLSFRKTT